MDEGEVEESHYGFPSPVAEHRNPPCCGESHRPSLLLPTPAGGAICLACFSNLLSDPSSPSHHVSYAISQLSQAFRGGNGAAFLRDVRDRHGHFLVLPLVQALSSANDDAVAKQLVDLISDLCGGGREGEGSVLARDFIARIMDLVSSGALGWSRRQMYTLHCLGVLLDGCCTTEDLPSCSMCALVANIVVGLKLPSEEMHGEILFVLYKLSLLQDMLCENGSNNRNTLLSPNGAKLLELSLEALLKTQSDDVRLNCIAFLTVLAKRGYFESNFTNDHMVSVSKEATEPRSEAPLINLFADAIKGPLLSCDTQVQIGALELIFHSFSSKMITNAQKQVLIDENIVDYVFEILRLSEKRDAVIVSSLQVLDLLETVESFNQKLVIGFAVLLSVLRNVAEVPLHPVQPHLLKLVESCVSKCPGLMSMSQLEDLALILTEIYRKHVIGELYLHPETFILTCSTFTEILKLPSSRQIAKIATLVQEASCNAILSSLTSYKDHNDILLHSLFLVKEAFQYCNNETNNMETNNDGLSNSILHICSSNLLPLLQNAVEEGEEEDVVMGVLETFHLILMQGPETQSKNFSRVLISSSWFSLSFEFLAVYPSERMKWRVYLMLSTLINNVSGQNFGQYIRDSYLFLPSDPLDLLFLLGQNTSLDNNLISAQPAVLSILYATSLYNERIADENQVLASLEQYVLVNSSNFSSNIVGSFTFAQLIYLYSFLRGIQTTYWKPYSSEAEKLLFHLITQNDWDMLSLGIHPTSLRWLFQQESIRASLAGQILNLCRFYNTNGRQINTYSSDMQILNIQMIADLVVSENNGATTLVLINLLDHCQQEGQQDDMVSVINVIQTILSIFPEASNQFCVYGIDSTVNTIYSLHFSTQIHTCTSLLVFNILQSVQSESLSSGEAWVSITMKLLESVIPRLMDEEVSQDLCLMLSILSLILYHSIKHVLVDASKTILLNSSLILAVSNMVQSCCAKGPALADYNEETSIGTLLTSVLMLYFLSLKSLCALLQENIDWKDFLHGPNKTQTYSVICISCYDLCRLIHFGSAPIKLIASKCLVELLNRITYQISTHNDLRCSLGQLRSMIAVVEGLLFYEDHKVATNCALCLCIVLGWEKFGIHNIKNSKWCRLIVEELALSLTAACLVSGSLTGKHKPAIYVAMALLRLDEVPVWMKRVFDDSCICGIIDKLSAANVTAEMVELFRELVACQYLNDKQVADLQHVFQVCHKHLYAGRYMEEEREENVRKVITEPEETGDIHKLLIDVILLTERIETVTITNQLLEQIEMFLQESTKKSTCDGKV